MKPILILKVGTSAITGEDRRPEQFVLESIAQQLAELSPQYNLVLVSSGAVGCGKKYMKHFAGSLADRRAAASIGNSILIEKYVEVCKPLGLKVSQALLERQHFSDRHRFLLLRETFQQLWKNDIIPIANENDVVSDIELKFSDNDELATLIAAGFSAQKLLLGTSVDGVLDDNKQLIKKIEQFDESIFSFAKEGSSLGMGGMRSKLNCAKRATDLGIEVVIFNARTPGNILLAEQHKTGTHCPARMCDISAHKKWIGSGSVISGKIVIDAGAYKALCAQKSLLAVGVTSVEGEFGVGEFFEIFTEGAREAIGVGRSEIDSRILRQSLAQHKAQGVEVAHVDGMVVF